MDRKDTLLVRQLIGGFASAAGLVVFSCGQPPASPIPDDRLPATIVWAWDRPEDLRFTSPATIGVAVFESIVTLDRGVVSVRPRHHPMEIPAGTKLFGVVRLEVEPGSDLEVAQRAEVLDAILAYHRFERTIGLQVDFDARRSEREFYRALIEDLRARLPKDHRFAITALASWCLGDPWLAGLAIDDAIPMLFRMGPDADGVRRYLNAGGEFSSPFCRRSVGLSTDEPWPRLPDGRRRYLFHPRPWTEAALVAALER